MHGPHSLTIALLVLAAFSLTAAAEQAADPLSEATQQYSRDRRRLIADNLHLTATEANRFWPVYEQFEKDLFVLTGKRRAIIARFGENYEFMTDAMAKELMIDRLKLEEELNRLRRTYLPKFEKVLPVKKLARYYQIESKIRSAVEAGIEEELPLNK
jgi:Spy/CpxP family protein refolding chaperone